MTARRAELVLAIDIGLTNCKAVLFDVDGRVIRRIGVSYATRRPTPDRVEQDPADWWAATVEAVRGVVAAGPMTGRVLAIGITAHMHALAAVDASLRPLGPALILGDRRAAREAKAITREIGADEIYAATGTAMDASMPAAKIRWLLDHEPERHAAARWFLACKDFVRARLTGIVATEPVDACATSLYDIRTGRWSAAIASAAGAPLATLPPVRPPEAIAGTLLPEPATALGLSPGTPVIVGAGDDVEVLGNGLLDHGSCLEHLGTTGSILVVSAEPRPDPGQALELYPHTLAGRWVLGGSMTTAGAALDWAARSLGFTSVGAAETCLADWPPRREAPLFLPHLEGARSPIREPYARGAWVGIGPASGRDQLMRAAFEGVALGLQAILSRTESLVGRRGPVAVSAGESADPRWLQVRADVYGRPLAVLETSEPTALGLFALAASALGLDQTPEAAVRRVVRIDRIVEPRNQPTLSARIAAFAAFDEGLRDRWPVLGGGS